MAVHLGDSSRGHVVAEECLRGKSSE
jgi:hypothetical protein